jgi:hypothetical protein
MSTKTQQQSLNGVEPSNGVAKQGESNQSEIARILQVDKSIIYRDVAYLREQAKHNIKRYIDQRPPEEYAVGLTINGFIEYLRLH